MHPHFVHGSYYGDDLQFRFRSVANAIRVGLFVDRFYRQLSSNALEIPPELQQLLKVSSRVVLVYNVVNSKLVSCKEKLANSLNHNLFIE